MTLTDPWRRALRYLGQVTTPVMVERFFTDEHGAYFREAFEPADQTARTMDPVEAAALPEAVRFYAMSLEQKPGALASAVRAEVARAIPRNRKAVRS